MSQKCFITTPIYYVNDKPHIGHAYTTMISDSVARYFRLKGDDVFFLTGTDEHGQKIERSAQAKGKETKEYVDEVSACFKDLWDYFGISYDSFIRTTDLHHKKGVQKAFMMMYEKGDIYKGEYEGHYCVSCETFVTSFALGEDTHCPECGRDTNIIKEESYFFALSRYQDRLLEWYRSDCILPRSKKNEVIRFVEGGLEDLSITRTSFSWGIPLPEALNEPKHVMYVWLDALLNYLTALGYGGDEKHLDFLPASYHFIGKDILRFHAIYWPAFLMSLEIPLPKYIATHGWWTRNGVKMSKSLGNVIDPKEVSEAYGSEPFRFFMLREVPFGQDGDFSQKALVDRINADLSNTLGNLLNRTTAMAKKFFGGSLSCAEVCRFYPHETQEATQILQSLPSLFERVALHRFLEELWKIFVMANASITQYEPWKMMKENKTQETQALLVFVSNLLLKGLVFLAPIMPQSVQKALGAFVGMVCDNALFRRVVLQNEWLERFELKEIPPLFPRIDQLLISEEACEARANTETSTLCLEDFLKNDMRVGTIKKAQRIPKSDKLLALEVDLGEGRLRSIVAGIGKDYAPEELLEKQVCVLANLKPVRLMGVLSEGMILASKDKKNLRLIAPCGVVSNGAKIG